MEVIRFEPSDGGGPRKVVTEDGECYIEWMARKGCVLEEIAEEMGVHRNTLSAPHNKERTQRAYDKGYAECNNRLRRAQVSHAIDGNAQLLIWLGKTRLGQRDESAVEVTLRKDKDSITYDEALEWVARDMDLHRDDERAGRRHPHGPRHED